MALPAQAGGVAGGDAISTWPDTAPRRRAVVLSDAYATRLKIHRTTAYAIIPLFAYQYVVGRRLWDGVHDTDGVPGWVRPAHRAGAIAIGTAFGVNAVTGGWNLWETRHQPDGRAIRVLHAASMTAALAGFTYAGVRLSDEARTSADKRSQHRTVAIGSMGLTLVSGTLMWLANR